MEFSKYIFLNRTNTSSQLYLPETKQVYHRYRTTKQGRIYKCIEKNCTHSVCIKNLTCQEINKKHKHNHSKTNEEKVVKNVRQISIIRTMVNEYPKVKEVCTHNSIKKIMKSKFQDIEKETIMNIRKEMLKKGMVYTSQIIKVEKVQIIPKEKIKLKNKKTM